MVTSAADFAAFSAMHPLLNVATAAARAAGNHIIRNFERADQLEVKQKGRNDFVSEVDQRAEALIVEVIREKYPDHAILAEEGGADGEHEVRWIIDPLDGTTNFLHQLPHFAVSLAAEVRGELAHGVVYNPFSQELFAASKGAGATLDGRKIRVSKHAHTEGALLGTGFPYRKGDDFPKILAALGEIMPLAAGIRRAGAASLDLAYVAAGRLDGFWEFNLAPWDVAAGMVIVKEAGGMSADIHGKGNPLNSGNIVAANPKLCVELGGVLQRSLRSS